MGAAPERPTGQSAWGPRPDGKQFLLGVEFADGRTATNQQQRGLDVPDDQPTLRAGSGSSGNGASSAQFYLTPLPPAGPVILVVAWPAFGITETRVELDGASIRDAASQTVTLWPDEPAAENPVMEPPKQPEYEPGGWFDTVARTNPDPAATDQSGRRRFSG